MTGRPAFRIDQDAPVTAANMNLISNSSIQRFATLADARTAFTAPNPAPNDGETIFAGDQDPPLMCWRESAGANGDWVPWVIVADQVEADASAGPVPTVGVVRQPPTVERWAGDPSEAGAGTLPAASHDDARTTGFDSYWDAGVAQHQADSPTNASPSHVTTDLATGELVAVTFTTSHIHTYRLRPPQTAAPTLASFTGGLPTVADTRAVRAAWLHADTLSFIVHVSGSAPRLWTLDVSSTANAPVNVGDITGMPNAPLVTAGCVHDGGPVIVTARDDAASRLFLTPVKLWDLSGTAATERGTIQWAGLTVPDRNEDVESPASAASHRGVLHLWTPQTDRGNAPASKVGIINPLWRVHERGDALDLEAVAAAPLDTTMSEEPTIGMAQAIDAEYGERCLYLLTRRTSTPFRLSQYRWEWLDPVYPWKL